MNKTAVFCIYSSAIIGAAALGVAYAWWRNKWDKKHPITTSVKFKDKENGERKIDQKLIKIIHDGLKRN